MTQFLESKPFEDAYEASREDVRAAFGGAGMTEREPLLAAARASRQTTAVETEALVSQALLPGMAVTFAEHAGIAAAASALHMVSTDMPAAAAAPTSDGRGAAVAPAPRAAGEPLRDSDEAPPVVLAAPRVPDPGAESYNCENKAGLPTEPSETQMRDASRAARWRAAENPEAAYADWTAERREIREVATQIATILRNTNGMLDADQMQDLHALLYPRFLGSRALHSSSFTKLQGIQREFERQLNRSEAGGYYFSFYEDFGRHVLKIERRVGAPSEKTCHPVFTIRAGSGR